MPAKKKPAPAAVADLSDLLGQATEEMNIAPTTDFEPVVIAGPTAEAAPDDFTDEPEPELFATEEVIGEPTVAPTPAEAKKSARRYIDFVDNLQKPFLVKAYRGCILQPGDEALMSAYELERAKRGKFSIEDAVSENDELYHAMNRAREFMQLCDQAAFTADEKDSLTGPLAEVLEKYQKLHLSPEMALVLAVAMVMLPRVVPLIPKFKTGFTF